MTATASFCLPRTVINCDECGFPIADGEGYLHVSYGEIRATEAQERERRHRQQTDPAGSSMTLNELLDESSPEWHSHHRRCDPAPDADAYWIDVARVRTWPQILERTCHLSEKTWYQLTDWTDVARRLSAQLERTALPGGA